MAVLAPMPSATVNTATIRNPLALESCRNAKRTSFTVSFNMPAITAGRSRSYRPKLPLAVHPHEKTAHHLRCQGQACQGHQGLARQSENVARVQSAIENHHPGTGRRCARILRE